MDQAEQSRWNFIDTIYTKGARSIVRHVQQACGQEVSSARERSAQKIPVPKAALLHIARPDHHIILRSVAYKLRDESR